MNRTTVDLPSPTMRLVYLNFLYNDTRAEVYSDETIHPEPVGIVAYDPTRPENGRKYFNWVFPNSRTVTAQAAVYHGISIESLRTKLDALIEKVRTTTNRVVSEEEAIEQRSFARAWTHLRQWAHDGLEEGQSVTYVTWDGWDRETGEQSIVTQAVGDGDFVKKTARDGKGDRVFAMNYLFGSLAITRYREKVSFEEVAARNEFVLSPPQERAKDLWRAFDSLAGRVSQVDLERAFKDPHPAKMLATAVKTSRVAEANFVIYDLETTGLLRESRFTDVETRQDAQQNKAIIEEAKREAMAEIQRTPFLTQWQRIGVTQKAIDEALRQAGVGGHNTIEHPRIRQIGLFRVSDEQMFEEVVNDETICSPIAVSIHKITDEMSRQSRKLNEVVKDVFTFIFKKPAGAFVAPQTVLMGYNNKGFDDIVLFNEMQRIGVDWPYRPKSFDIFFLIHCLIGRLSALKLPYGHLQKVDPSTNRGRSRLVDVYSSMYGDILDAHQAGDDAKMTGRVWQRLVENLSAQDKQDVCRAIFSEAPYVNVARILLKRGIPGVCEPLSDADMRTAFSGKRKKADSKSSEALPTESVVDFEEGFFESECQAPRAKRPRTQEPQVIEQTQSDDVEILESPPPRARKRRDEERKEELPARDSLMSLSEETLPPIERLERRKLKSRHHHRSQLHVSLSFDPTGMPKIEIFKK